MSKSEFQAQLIELQKSIYNRLPIYKARFKLALVLAKEAFERIIAKYIKRGRLTKAKLTAVKREFTAVTAKLVENLMTRTEAAVTDVVERASTATSAALLMAAGLSASLALNTAVTTAGALLGLGSILLTAHIATILEFVFDREGSDSFVLQDRFRVFADDLTQGVITSLRATISNSEEIDDIPALVNQVFDANEWRVDRIADTEIAYALRTTIAEGARYSELVDAIKIVDFPHGNYHEKHECYKYAHRDEHGLGMGIYPIETEKIRNPHPQCRSRLILVLREGVLSA